MLINTDVSRNITRLRQYFSLSPLPFLMKNLKSKSTKGDLRLRTVQRMIWGVVRLKAVEIQVHIAARSLGQGE